MFYNFIDSCCHESCHNISTSFIKYLVWHICKKRALILISCVILLAFANVSFSNTMGDCCEFSLFHAGTTQYIWIHILSNVQCICQAVEQQLFSYTANNNDNLLSLTYTTLFPIFHCGTVNIISKRGLRDHNLYILYFIT